MSTSIVTVTSSEQLLGQLTNNANIINLSSTSQVLVASLQPVNSATAIPLAPLASYAWSAKGSAYIRLDPAAPDASATVLITDDVTNYDNPIALASAVASELLASGVPNVLLTDVLYSDPIIVATNPIPVNSFSELIIIKPQAMKLQIAQSSDVYAANQSYTETIGAGPYTMALPVTDMYLTLINANATGGNVVIIGSNRDAKSRFDCRANNGLIDSWAITPAANYAAGSVTTLNHATPTVVLAGPIFGWFYFPGASAPCAYRVVDSANQLLYVCDSGEAITAFNGNRICTKTLAFPIGGIVSMQLQMGSTAANFTPQVQLVAASSMN